MAVCAYCSKVVDDVCPRCKAPDALVERKYNKHDGKTPVSYKRQASAEHGAPSTKPFKWPSFKPGSANENSGK